MGLWDLSHVAQVMARLLPASDPTWEVCRGVAHGHFNCVLGTWSSVGTKPISLGPQTHNRPTLHQELGVSAAPRTFTSCPWIDLGWSPRLASPCTPP